MYGSNPNYDEQRNPRLPSTDRIVQQYLRPNFHCTKRPANLNNVQKYNIHPALASMWLEAEEWHLLPSDHCDVSLP